jgi:UDP-galactose transporter B1
MLLNVLLYRRKFASHKYIVVALVTAGISVFMLLAPKKAGKGGGSDSLWGLALLVFK